MARYKYFWDLQSSQAYTTHTVDQFDANTPNAGGGTFTWIPRSNVGIYEIPGYRIKPSSTTAGYWQRETDGDAFNISWFGTVNTSAQLTLGGYGLTLAQVNARYNSRPNASNTVTLADTYDTAAMKLAFDLMADNQFYKLCFENKEYFITSTCYLPRKNTTSRYPMWTLDGQGCVFKPHSTVDTTAFTMWDRAIVNQADARDTQSGSKFIMKDMQFRGGSTKAQKAMQISATYNSVFESIGFFGLAYGMHLRFCLGAYINMCQATQVQNYSVWLDCGTTATALPNFPGGWSGTTVNDATSQSNSVCVNKFRNWADVSTNIAIYSRGNSGLVINEPILEGDAGSPADYGVYFDNAGVTAVKDFTIRRAHIEMPFNTAGIYIRNGAGNGQYVVDGIYSQKDTSIVYVENNSGATNIIVRDVAFISAPSTFGNTGTAANTTNWLFEYCRTFDPSDPTVWVGTQPVARTWSAIPGGGHGEREVYPFNVR